jgi:uncharacterized protein YndB with AHSA1/START domain
VERMIYKEVAISASLRDAWHAWTTPEGVRTFFAPAANVELRVGGAYEMLFDLDAPAGSRGSEGCNVLSFLPDRMLSFDWNAPPAYPEVRRERTWVVVELTAGPLATTRVALTHLGWKEGEDWDHVFDYFRRAWDTVLGRLAYRFSQGPIDWGDPYRPALPEA